jgi:hypothetical protein
MEVFGAQPEAINERLVGVMTITSTDELMSKNQKLTAIAGEG